MANRRGGAANVPSAGFILSASLSPAGLPTSMPRIGMRVTHSRRGSYAMTRHVFVKLAAMMVSAAAIGVSAAYAQSSTGQITVLYDAFGKTSTMKKDWGFSALIEYGGKRILFDTGNNAEIFAHNVEAKGIDLKQLDFAVVSHRHGDHTSGLNHLLKINPGVKIYAPQENFGVFGATLPGTFYRCNESLPSDMRYFDGSPPETLRFGSPWPEGNFTWITKTTEVAPGFHLILLNGTWGGHARRDCSHCRVQSFNNRKNRRGGQEYAQQADTSGLRRHSSLAGERRPDQQHSPLAA
jgi:glyoxylase-like metal-dependent hydrolase (beta-lactamase superfamily II)